MSQYKPTYCIKLLILAILLSGSYMAHAINYTSQSSGSWSNASNWNPAGVPVSGDNVTIENGHIVSYSGNLQWMTGTLSIVGNGKLITTGSFTYSGGTLTIGNSGTLEVGTNFMNDWSAIFLIGGNLLVSGDIENRGIITVNGNLTSQNGGLLNNATRQITVGGDVSVKTFLSNNGSFDVTGGVLVSNGYFSNGQSYTCNIGQSLTASGDITNQGTLTIDENCTSTGGQVINDWSRDFTVGGNLSANTYVSNAGTLQITGNLSVSNGGMINEDPDHLLRVSLDVSVNGEVTNKGIMDFDGDLTISSGNLNLLNLAILAVDGNFSKSGNVNVDNSQMIIGGNFISTGGSTTINQFNGVLYVFGSFSASTPQSDCINGCFPNSSCATCDIKSGSQWVADSEPGNTYITYEPATAWWEDHLANIGETDGPSIACLSSTMVFEVDAVTASVGSLTSNTFEWAVYGGSITGFNGTPVSSHTGTSGGHATSYQSIHGIDGTTIYTLNVQWESAAFAGAYVAVRQISDIGCTDEKWSIFYIDIQDAAAPTGSALQVFCAEAGPTVAELTATGTGIQWYLTATGGSPLASGIELINGIYYASQTVNGCESSVRFPVTVTLREVPTATIGGTATVCQNAAPAGIVFTNPQPLAITVSYNIDEGPDLTVLVPASSTATVNAPTTTSGTFIYNLVSVIYQSFPACTNPVEGTATLTVTPLPSATISYAGNPFCFNTGPIAVTQTGTSGGTYSALPAGLIINSGTGAVNTIGSTPGTYTVSYTVEAFGGCSVYTTTTAITIVDELVWTGAVSTDWNTSGNWTCNAIPNLTTNVLIPNVGNKPILSSGAQGTSKNIEINSGSSLTVIGNTLQIAGTITSNGTFTATSGSIEMKGSVQQNIGANSFAGNTIKDLIISNPAGTVLQGSLNVTGAVAALLGDLTSNGYLTLVSNSTQTALIDGAGTGSVLGNVTMQRYLPLTFGYKYFSSPFQGATVGEFADDLDLNASFPTFYRYDENQLSPLGEDMTGWIAYTSPAGTLSPLKGYAGNFGEGTDPATVDVSGIVSNGSVQVSLMNHNRFYTKGFNLVGNPYPSPIDWNAPGGWTKTNIDNAIYFFNAGNTDQYTGSYASYVNGIATGNASNLIASMQGFFVHVTDGTYPVSATLGTTNLARVSSFAPVFKHSRIDNRPKLYFTANFDTKNAIQDEAIIYFDDELELNFDSQDALKMQNTDVLIPNMYTLTSDSRNLQINGMPYPTDSLTKVQLGFTTLSDGWIKFKAQDISLLPADYNLYLTDDEKGLTQDLKQNPVYKFYLTKGVHANRFNLVFSLSEIDQTGEVFSKLFTISRSGNLLLVKSNLPKNTRGNLLISNMMGQILLRQTVTEKMTVELNTTVSTGVYVVTLISGKNSQSEKILIRDDHE